MAILTSQIIDVGVSYLNAVYLSGGTWYKAVSPITPEGIYVGENTVNTGGFYELLDSKTIKFRHGAKTISTTSNDTTFEFDGTDIETLTPSVDSVPNLNLLTDGVSDYVIIQNTTGAPISIDINKLGGVEFSEDDIIWNSPSAESSVTIPANDTIIRYYRHDKDDPEISLPSIFTFDGTIDIELGVDLKPEFELESTYIGQESSELELTILNTKSTDLVLNSISTPTNFIKSTSEPATISGGSSGTVGFKFSPSTIGTFDEDSTITFDTSSTQLMSLSGTGLSLLTVDPSEINFGTFLVGVETGIETFDIINSNTMAKSVTITAPSGFTFREQNIGSYVSTMIISIDASSTKTFQIKGFSILEGAISETLNINYDGNDLNINLLVTYIDDSELDVLANISYDKNVIDFNKLKKDNTRINNFTVTIDGSSESMTIRAPEGYYLIDPATGDQVKVLQIVDGDVLIQNTGDRISLYDGNGISLITSHGSFLLTDSDELIITDDDEEIEVIQ